MSKKLLSIKDISKTYFTLNKEILAIKDFTFTLYENDFVAIVGPSGCGKSTLLSIINKQEKQTTGSIDYYNKKIGYMLQDDALFEWLTVYENCILGLKIRKELNKDNIDYVLNLLKKYGLYEFINNYPNDLSGGMRQRVALIRTLATKPDILLMDEPFSSLDYQSRLMISGDIYNILKSEGKTLLLVTHDIAEALTLCNKIIVLTNRPSSIKKVYNINFEYSDLLSKRESKEFKKYYNQIWKDIDYV